MEWPKPEGRSLKPASFLLPAIFGDVHDLVLKNEQVGRTLARQSHHVLVVILNPPAHHLPVHQLHADWLLLFAQPLEKAGFFESLFRRRRPPPLAGISVSLRTERHEGIVHKAPDWIAWIDGSNGMSQGLGLQFAEQSLAFPSRRFAVKSSILNSLLFLFLSASLLCAQTGRPIPAGVRQADQAQDQFEKNSVPPIGQRSAIDPAKLKHDADELAALAQSVPTAVDQTTKGILPKDLNDKLKRIEKLAKELRSQISR